MSTSNDGWYVAEPDGYTVGPLSRAEVASQRAGGAFSAQALAWHVDISEWRPLVVLGVNFLPQDTLANAGPRPAPRAVAAATAPAVARPAVPNRNEPNRKQKPRTAAATKSAPVQDPGTRLLSQAAALKDSTQEAKAKVAQTGAHAAVALRRFLARALDTTTLGMLGAAALWGVVQRTVALDTGTLPETPPVALLLIIAVAALIPLEALALAITGTTPGKALLGLRVTRGQGKPGLIHAWRRAFDVAWRGMGMGIPVVSFITAIVGFASLVNKGTTPWDAKHGLQTRAAPVDSVRWQMAIAAAIGALVLLSSAFWPELALQIANTPPSSGGR